MELSTLTSYDDLTKHIVPGPRTISYFIPVPLLFIALLVPPSILSKKQQCLLFLPAIYVCQIHAWLAMGGVDVLSVSCSLWSFALLVHYDPRRIFRRVRVGVNPPTSQSSVKPMEGNSMYCWEEPYPSDISKRISWILTLMLSFRLGNWKIGDLSHDKMQPEKRLSRKAFFKHAMILDISSYLIADITCSYIAKDPYFFTALSVDSPLPQGLFRGSNYLNIIPSRLVRILAVGGQAYSMVSLMFYVPAIPALVFNALGLLPDEWSPQNTSVYFGAFNAVPVKGIRGLWGGWWHQMNRYIMSTPGRCLNQALKVPTSSTLGYAILVTSGFFFSGILHMGLVPPQPLLTQYSPNQIRLLIGAFFWSQVPGIGIEVLVERLLQNHDLKKQNIRTEAFVFAWTLTWLSLTLPLLTVPFQGLRYWKANPLPFSLISYLFGRGS